MPEACPETEALRQASNPPPLKVMARCLGNELDALETPVTEDYNLASSKFTGTIDKVTINLK
ncbi:MAG: hypothetical protein WBP34_09560 [Thermoanaerobaculia bacterium]